MRIEIQEAHEGNRGRSDHRSGARLLGLPLGPLGNVKMLEHETFLPFDEIKVGDNTTVIADVFFNERDRLQKIMIRGTGRETCGELLIVNPLLNEAGVRIGSRLQMLHYPPGVIQARIKELSMDQSTSRQIFYIPPIPGKYDTVSSTDEEDLAKLVADSAKQLHVIHIDRSNAMLRQFRDVGNIEYRARKIKGTIVETVRSTKKDIYGKGFTYRQEIDLLR